MTAKLTPQEREERNDRIRFLHDVGQSERQIARTVGISRSAVWGVLQAGKPKSQAAQA